MVDTDKKIFPAEVSMPDKLKTFDEKLEAGTELRIYNITDHIKVLIGEGGRAEVFGRELPINEPVFFHQGEKFAIYCWRPTRITICGQVECDPSNNTPMHIYVNIQCALNQLRLSALNEKRIGPNLLVTGSHLSGKSTLCRMLVNYAIKQGWTPVLADIDLQSSEISPLGTISASLISESTVLPSDSHSKNTLSYFHGNTHIITDDFFNKQVIELADAVKLKLENDLNQFKGQFQLETVPADEDLKEVQQLVRPVFPQLFASGCIINGFTPDGRQTDTLINAIEKFEVDVVLVIDNERLEKSLTQKLLNRKQGQKPIKVIKVPKSSGVDNTKGELSEVLFNEYRDYFRGKHYEVFSKNQQNREELGLVEQAVRNELDPQPINLPVDKIKIFEVKGSEIPLSLLPAHCTEPEKITLVEPILPQDLEKGMADYKHRILSVLVPKEIAVMKQLEQRIAQNQGDETLKEEFRNCLMRSCTTEFLQIKDFKPDSKTQKKTLEVVRTCANKEKPQAKNAAEAGEPGQGATGESVDSGLGGLASSYFMISKFNLKKNVF